VEAVQAPAALTASTSTLADLIPGLLSGSSSLTTHRLLPCYQGRHLDNTDLIESIDRVTMGLAETLTLVDSIRDRSLRTAMDPSAILNLLGLAARGVLTLIW
jgi:hypothetical protein